MENRRNRVICSIVVDVNQFKAAIQKLNRELVYKSVDEAAKQVVEVTNNTTSTMLEKASKTRLLGSSNLRQGT